MTHCGLRSDVELAFMEPGVCAAPGQQLVMGAALDYAAVVDDEYLVGALNGGQTVCDGETGATAH